MIFALFSFDLPFTANSFQWLDATASFYEHFLLMKRTSASFIFLLPLVSGLIVDLLQTTSSIVKIKVVKKLVVFIGKKSENIKKAWAKVLQLFKKV